MCILQIIIRKTTNKYGFIWWNGFGVYNVIEIVVQKYKENRKSPNLFPENVGKSPNLYRFRSAVGMDVVTHRQKWAKRKTARPEHRFSDVRALLTVF